MRYVDYLKSEHWQEIKYRHREKGLSDKCLSCENTNVDLHHRSYERKGREQLLDLLPLCRKCHHRVHEYAREHGMKLQATHKILRLMNGWTKKETRKRFERFSLSKKGFRWVLHDKDMAKIEAEHRKAHKMHRSLNEEFHAMFK